MTRPRVAYVLKMYPRFSETFVLSELLELERQGADLRVFSLKRPDDGIEHADVARLSAPVVYLPESLAGLVRAQGRALRLWPRRYLRMLAAVLRRARWASLKHFLQAGAIAPELGRDGVRHVHAHFASGATSVALYLGRLAEVSYSFTAHAKDIYLDTVRPADLVRKLQAARFAVTVSDFNVRHLARYANGSRIVRVYNGLDLERFVVNGVARERPPLVLAIGRLIEKKGFDDLIRACAILAGERTPFRCAIVGKGPLREQLAGLVAELGLEGRVELAGPLPRERLVDLYPRASALAAPCVVGSDGNRDGLPTVLVEAMALGVPVVATDVTGIPELVEDGLTGLLVPQRDPAALAAAVRQLFSDPDGASALARRARERVEARFDLRVNVAELRRLFAEATT
jgi:colanic acid/amylovoran biosynthesis glycosyltransferase